MITPPSHGIRSLDRGFSWTQQPLIAISPSFLPLLFSLDRSPIPSSFVLSFFSPFPSLSSCFIRIRRLNDTSSSSCFFLLLFFFFSLHFFLMIRGSMFALLCLDIRTWLVTFCISPFFFSPPPISSLCHLLNTAGTRIRSLNFVCSALAKWYWYWYPPLNNFEEEYLRV